MRRMHGGHRPPSTLVYEPCEHFRSDGYMHTAGSAEPVHLFSHALGATSYVREPMRHGLHDLDNERRLAERLYLGRYLLKANAGACRSRPRSLSSGHTTVSYLRTHHGGPLPQAWPSHAAWYHRYLFASLLSVSTMRKFQISARLTSVDLAMIKASSEDWSRIPTSLKSLETRTRHCWVLLYRCTISVVFLAASLRLLRALDLGVGKRYGPQWRCSASEQYCRLLHYNVRCS